MERSFRVINFDVRGRGMSERDVTEVSAATLLKDAEAVLGAAKADQVIVFSDMGQLPASIALQLAVTHPERVTHVVLESPFQNDSDLADTAMGRLGPVLAEAEWDVFVQTYFRVLAGWDANDNAWLEPVVKSVAGWIDASVGRKYVRLMQTLDLAELLPRVTQPTLVLRNDPGPIPTWVCQRVTAQIRGAQFRPYKDPTFLQQVELTREFVEESAVVVAVLQAVPESVAWSRARGAPVAAADLSPREIEILRLVAQGRSSREIGNQLVLSVRTIERHISNIYRKIDAHNRAQAASYALEHGFLGRL